MRFAVTGATGWLGRAAAEALAARMHGDQVAERLLLFASRERNLQLDGGAVLRVAPLEELPSRPFDALLHYAYVTRELLAERGLDDYVRANLDITTTVLAAISSRRPSAVVVASSGAAVAAAASGASVSEDPYGALKAIDELALRRAAVDAGARTLVLRVYSVSGRWLSKPSTFALSDMLMQALAGGPVVIGARGAVRRSFVDVQDLAEVAVRFAKTPQAGNDVVVGTAGDRVVEIGELARLVVQCVRPAEPSVVRNEEAQAPANDYFDSTPAFDQLARRLGIEPLSTEQQVARTAAYLREVTA